MNTLELHYPMIQFLVKSDMFFCINLYLHVTKLEGKDQSTQKKRWLIQLVFAFHIFFRLFYTKYFQDRISLANYWNGKKIYLKQIKEKPSWNQYILFITTTSRSILRAFSAGQTHKREQWNIFMVFLFASYVCLSNMCMT